MEVSGDLEDGEDFTVELTGAGRRGGVVGDRAVHAHRSRGSRSPTPVAVGEVAAAGVSQGITVVAGRADRAAGARLEACGGGGGAGQLALSMVMAVLLVAIVFRTPLPSATTQRWTK